MIILNLLGHLAENLTISDFFNVTLGTISNNYSKESSTYSSIKKSIEIELANRVESFKGEGFVLEEAFKTDKNQQKFLYYKVLAVYKELLNESGYKKREQDNFFVPTSAILNEISSDLDGVVYNDLRLTEFFGGINEIPFEEHFLNFFNFLKRKIKTNSRILNSTRPLIYLKPFQYESDFLSNMDIEPLRIHYMEGYTSMLNKFQDEVDLLITFGNLLDNYFLTHSDANKFIFILKNLPFEKNQDNYSLFLSSISILELFKKNGHSWTEIEKEELTKYFYGPSWVSTKEEISLILKIRNKLVHADYNHYFKFLNEYKEIYMKNFEFDRFEATDYQWILENITFKVKNAVSNVIWEVLTGDNN